MSHRSDRLSAQTDVARETLKRQADELERIGQETAIHTADVEGNLGRQSDALNNTAILVSSRVQEISDILAENAHELVAASHRGRRPGKDGVYHQ